MVDQEARRRYAELVRQFISGRMTNEEYEARFEAIECNTNDPAVFEAYHQVWFLYDDIKTHRMTGAHRLDRAGRRTIARMVLFLHSDEEYQWLTDLWNGSVFLITALLVVLLFALFPETALINKAVIAAVLTSAWINYERGQRTRRENRYKMAGDTGAWPFLRQADLDEAARHPRLLNGH